MRGLRFPDCHSGSFKQVIFTLNSLSSFKCVLSFFIFIKLILRILLFSNCTSATLLFIASILLKRAVIIRLPRRVTNYSL